MSKIKKPGQRFKDVTGETFGHLKVLGYSHTEHSAAHFKVYCDCGKYATAKGAELRNGSKTTCSMECFNRKKAETTIGTMVGSLYITSLNDELTNRYGQAGRTYYVNSVCINCESLGSHKLTDITTGKITSCNIKCASYVKYKELVGSKYERLQVVSVKHYQKGRDNPRFYLECLCDCGTTKDFALKDVLSGASKSCGCYQSDRMKTMVGDKNGNFKDNATTELQRARTSTEYYNWQRAVFERDGWKCQKCFKYSPTGFGLCGHHILNFSSHVELRFDTENGISFCSDCHSHLSPTGFHKKYTNFNNTRRQVEEFLQQNKKEDICD